jgi:hypothetical protein
LWTATMAFSTGSLCHLTCRYDRALQPASRHFRLADLVGRSALVVDTDSHSKSDNAGCLILAECRPV